MNTSWRNTEKKIEEIDKMNAVRERDAGILSRALEPAESRLQHLEPAKLVLDNRIAHP